MKRRAAAWALLLAAASLAGDPGQFRGGPERAGSDGGAAPASPAVLWKFRDPRDPGRFCSSPVVVDGRLYIGCDNESVYCFDAAAGGKPLWTFQARSWVFASPVVSGDTVYIGEGLHVTRDARIRALDAATGKLRWEHVTKSHVESAVAVAGGRVYAGAGDDGMLCLDAATGALIWQARGLHIDSAPLLQGDLVVAGSGYGKLQVTAWKAATGEVAWKRETAAAAWGPPAAGPAGILVATGNGTFGSSAALPKAEVLCLSAEDGSVVWRTRLRNASLTAVAVAGDRAWLGDRSGDVLCLDARTGAKIWTAGCGHPVLSSPAIASDAVVNGCNGGHVHGWDRATGKALWTVNLGREGLGTATEVMSSPFLSNGKIWIGSNNGSVYCLGDRP